MEPRRKDPQAFLLTTNASPGVVSRKKVLDSFIQLRRIKWDVAVWVQQKRKKLLTDMERLVCM